MNTNPHRHIVSASSLLRALTKEIVALNESLLPSREAPVRRTRQAKPKQVAHKSTKPYRRLSDIEEHDIGRMLVDTNLPVSKIAQLYSISRAAVYNLRSRLGLRVHFRPTAHKETPETPQHAVSA